jgi:hypothetical protein
LGTDAVTTEKIADGTIQEQDIADGVIPSSGGGGGTTGQIETVRVVENVNIQPGQLGDAIANCDASHPVANGGGFDTERNPGPQVRVLGSNSAPTQSTLPTGWHVHAVNDDPNNSHIIAVYAICANIVP